MRLKEILWLFQILLFPYKPNLKCNSLLLCDLNIRLLNQFLNVLQRIENGEMDQHEGSYLVGKILKEIYIDSALKKADKLDKQRAASAAVPSAAVHKISWKEFKASKQSQ